MPYLSQQYLSLRKTLVSVSKDLGHELTLYDLSVLLALSEGSNTINEVRKATERIYSELSYNGTMACLDRLRAKGLVSSFSLTPSGLYLLTVLDKKLKIRKKI